MVDRIPISALLKALDAPDTPPLYRRLSGTALRALHGARRSNEPDDLRWMVENAAALAERLSKNKTITETTASTYASRARSAGLSFLEKLEPGTRVLDDSGCSA